MLNVLIARHGQSEWNQSGRWQGQADPDLSEFGVTQAKEAAKLCGSFDAIVASNLARATRTATIIADVVGVGPVLVDSAFSERDVGDYQGLTRAEIDQKYPGQLEAGIWPNGWETDQSVLQRVKQGLARLWNQCSDANVLVIAHGGVIYAIERYFGENYKRISNLEGRWLHHDGTSWNLGKRVSLTQQSSTSQELIL